MKFMSTICSSSSSSFSCFVSFADDGHHVLVNESLMSFESTDSRMVLRNLMKFSSINNQEKKKTLKIAS